MRKRREVHQACCRLWRLGLVILLLLAGLSGLLWRLVSLSVAERDFLQDQGDARARRLVSDRAPRGVIVDRNGVPLAVTAPVYSVWIDPAKSDLSNAQIGSLSRLLTLPGDGLWHRYQHYRKKRFMYVLRDVSPHQAQMVKKLSLKGVHLMREGKRYYPAGEVAAQLIGKTDVDEHGKEGLELEYESWLKGELGQREVIKDRLGRVIKESALIRAAQPGHELQLSIDHRMQYVVFRELKSGVKAAGARSGSAVLLDVHTGEVLAMANVPSFNPNARHTRHLAAHRNRALTDMLEPGSTLKPFGIANALASGQYTPKTKIDTNPGILWLNGNKVIDENINHGVISVSDVLVKSSNIGMAKMTLALPANSLWETLDKFGFGQATGVRFPGESFGRLVMPHRWSDFSLATLSFGYGMAATPTQLARAYAVIANGGKLLPLSLLKVDHPPEGKQVLNAKISRQLLEMLHRVTEFGGTGWRAEVLGVSVAGKTGTALLAGEHGYKDRRYISSFTGIVPVDEPRYVLVVSIVEPDPRQHYGGLVAAPIFSKIMRSVLALDSGGTLQEQQHEDTEAAPA